MALPRRDLTMDAQAEKQHLLDQIEEYSDPEYPQVISLSGRCRNNDHST